MPKQNDMVIPYTLEGQDISGNNETLGAVVVEMVRTGKDPLQGTGLTYGEYLSYDVAPSAPAASGPEGPGAPATPNEVPFSASNPYPGMGSF